MNLKDRSHEENETFYRFVNASHLMLLFQGALFGTMLYLTPIESLEKIRREHPNAGSLENVVKDLDKYARMLDHRSNATYFYEVLNKYGEGKNERTK